MLILASVGVAFVSLTVKTKVFVAESTVPSLTLAVMVEVPVQLLSGVSVSVVTETPGVT